MDGKKRGRRSIERRGVAQPGSALAWGARGRRFKSGRPDQHRGFVQEKRGGRVDLVEGETREQ